MQAFALLAIAVLLGGCASQPRSGSVYRPAQTLNEQSVRLGYVESVREVTIVGPDSGTGAMAGMAIGSAAASSNAGRGNGSFLASIIGAVAGGLIGHHVEANANRHRGFEITVKLDSGELLAITQAADELFQPGERVRLLSSSSGTRVTH